MCRTNNDTETRPNNSSDIKWWEYFIPGYNFHRIIEWAGDRYAKPAKVAVQDLAKANVIVPLRKKLGLSSRPSLLTERNFDSRFISTLDSIDVSQLNSQVPDWKRRTENGDTVRILVHGKDYVANYGGTKVKRSLVDRISSPIGQIETTLGSHIVDATRDAIIRYDDYDWDSRVSLDEATPYGFLRNVMGEYGTQESAPQDEKIRVKIISKRIKR